MKVQNSITESHIKTRIHFSTYCVLQNKSHNKWDRCDVSVYTGVSKRSWQAEIIQDDLEEAEEAFEVLLVSPEGTVIGSINKAQVTIRESGRKEEGRGKNKPQRGIFLRS